jgi:coenzyme F420-reducing hydrogenase delta subunit
VKSRWILHAFEKGIDGVFIGSDGTDCAYRSDCSDLSSKVIEQTQEVMKERGINIARVKMAALCSVCADPFVNHMKNFSEFLTSIGNIKNETGQNNE